MQPHEVDVRALCEIRTEQLSERIITTRLVPYGVTSRRVPSPKGERFLPGSLTKSLHDWSLASRPLKLFRSHNYGEAVGLAHAFEPDAAGGPLAEFRVAETRAGDDALDQIDKGLLDSVSVGFHAIRERRGHDGARELLEAALLEASLTPIGAYDGADVLAVREATVPLQLPDLSLPPPPKVDLSRPVWR